MLGLSTDTLPTVVVNDDVLDQTTSAGRKNVEYKTQVFVERVELYSPNKVSTDLFLFGWAGNIQKVGRVLTEKNQSVFLT